MNDTIRITFSAADQTGQAVVNNAQALYQTLDRLQFTTNTLLNTGLQGGFLDELDARCRAIQNELRFVGDETSETGRDLLTVSEWFRGLDADARTAFEQVGGYEDGVVIAGVLLGLALYAGYALLYPTPTAAPTWIEQGNEIMGEPETLEKYYETQVGNTCGFQATRNILKAFGYDRTLEELKARAGYGPDKEGTLYEDYEKMFDDDIPVIAHEKFASSHDAVASLIADLQQNKAVLARINVAGLDTYWGEMSGGHAVWITGVRRDEEGNITHFICNDSGLSTDRYKNGSWNGMSMDKESDGIPDGEGVEYRVEEFLEAWSSRSYSYIVTKDSIPNFNE